MRNKVVNLGKYVSWSIKSFTAMTVMTIILAMHPSSARADPDRVALVIGNGRYLHTPALKNPENDASAIAETFRNLGFDVRERANLGSQAMKIAIAEFLHDSATARLSVLFYAGHGLQVSGKNYIVPVDAELTTADALNRELVEVDSLVSTMNRMDQASIVILDACRNNPLAGRLARTLGSARSADVQTGLAAYTPTVIGNATHTGTGVLIAYSTAPGTVALDGEGPNSPFTTALVKHVADAGLEIRQVLSRVRADVAASTANEQIPWDNSSLFGDVYLTPSAPSSKPNRNQNQNCFTFDGQEFCQ